MSMMRFKASISPWMLPPRATSMTGNVSTLNTSPATTTSERRKKTRRSPSEWAAGCQSSSMGSSLKYSVRLAVKNVTVGQNASGSGC
jgi:hypothetical protein